MILLDWADIPRMVLAPGPTGLSAKPDPRAGNYAAGGARTKGKGAISRPLPALREVGALGVPGLLPVCPRDQLVTAVAVGFGVFSVTSTSRPKTAKATMTRPTPVSRSATPTTRPKIESCSAM